MEMKLLTASPLSLILLRITITKWFGLEETLKMGVCVFTLHLPVVFHLTAGGGGIFLFCRRMQSDVTGIKKVAVGKGVAL